MRADDVLEAVLGAAVVAAAVGEKHGGAAHAEEAIRDEHGPFLAGVPIVAHHLGADHYGVVIRVCLEHVPGEVDADDAGAATHSAEVVAEDVPPHLVVVDDHGGEGGRRVEDAAVDDQDADVLWPQPRLLEELVECSEHYRRGLGAALLHCGRVLTGGDHRTRDVGLVAYARRVEGPLLEF